MKKFIIGLILSLNFVMVTPSHAFLGGITSAVNEVSGIVSGVSGIVSSVNSLFGGSSGSSAGTPATGLFDGDEARIYDGSTLTGGINTGVDNVVSSGVVIVQDFDAIFESIEGRVGVTPTGQFVLPDPEKFNQIGENTSLRQYILNVLNFALTFLGLIAVAFIVYAGFLYVTSAGDDGNMEKAKKIILYAVIGILVILAAFALVNTVIQNAGRGTGDRGEIPEGAVVTQTGTNTDGTITLPNGTVLTTPETGTGGNSNIASQLGNLITVSGEGVQDFGGTAVATPAGAVNGVTFGLATQAQALFDFGDGTQAVLNTIDNPNATIVHQFGESRSFPIRVIIENTNGTLPVRKELVVGGLEAKFNMNRAEISVGESLSLDASATNVTVGSISGYTWTCEGGEGCFSETFGKNAAVEFSAPGEYTVTLTVENVLKLSDSYSKTIRVIGGAPVANFSFKSAQNLQQPAEFTFNATQSVNRAGDTSGLTYFWNFDGDFIESSQSQVNYEFDSVGIKTVELVVVEKVQGTSWKSEAVSQQVEVETVIPVDFTVE